MTVLALPRVDRRAKDLAGLALVKAGRFDEADRSSLTRIPACETAASPSGSTEGPSIPLTSTPRLRTS